MVIALGMLRQRSMLRAEPIRTPHRKATHTTDEPPPTKHPLYMHTCAHKLKTFKEKEDNTVLMTCNCHFTHSLYWSPINIVSVPEFVALLTQYCSLLVLSFLRLKMGGGIVSTCLESE